MPVHSDYAGVTPANERKLIPFKLREMLKLYSRGRGETSVSPQQLLELTEQLCDPLRPSPCHVIGHMLRSIHTLKAAGERTWPYAPPVFRKVGEVKTTSMLVPTAYF